VFERLAASIAPEIYGMREVKKVTHSGLGLGRRARGSWQAVCTPLRGEVALQTHKCVKCVSVRVYEFLCVGHLHTHARMQGGVYVSLCSCMCVCAQACVSGHVRASHRVRVRSSNPS
jgi:hypothetical protein